jgi:hypothetical protein
MNMEYEHLAGRGESLLDLLMPPDDQDFDFEPPRSCFHGQPADFST